VEVLTGTHEHPFWVEAEQSWVPLGELAAGDVLSTDGGGRAVVVGLTVRPGATEVFNIEVAGPHNYFVRADGGDGPGVLVHNKGKKKCDPVRQAADAIQEYLGPGMKLIINDAGDYIFRNAANTRRVQFHLNDFSPHDAPHGHVDRRPGKKRWYKCKNDPIYFK
jgi:hypothetical protein